MSSSILVADVTSPFAGSLVGAMNGQDLRAIPVSGLHQAERQDSGFPGILWNRPSSLSARTVVLDALNRSPRLDGAVLSFELASGLDPVRVCDEYIRGFMLLASELAGCFARQRSGFLVFAFRPSPAGGDIAVSVAGAAFTRLAEETAASFVSGGKSEIRTLLVRLESGDNAADADWLVPFLRQPSLMRPGVRWLKAGSRGLPLFTHAKP